MTPEEFNSKWLDYRKDVPLFSADFDSMLATVRDEARLAALEVAAKEVDSWYGSPTRCAKAIREKARPPRTLDDVLGDINTMNFTLDNCDRLLAIARTAVEGLKEYNKAQSFRHTVLDETIRKLLEIR